MSAKRKALAFLETKWCVLTQHRLCFANTPPRIARRDPYAFLQATRENVEATGKLQGPQMHYGELQEKDCRK